MITVRELYTDSDSDMVGTNFPRIRYKMVNSTKDFFTDVERPNSDIYAKDSYYKSDIDILSIREFDYSRLKILHIGSITTDCIVDVARLMQLPKLKRLTLYGMAVFINGSLEDILYRMKLKKLKIESLYEDDLVIDKSGIKHERVVLEDPCIKAIVGQNSELKLLVDGKEHH